MGKPYSSTSLLAVANLFETKALLALGQSSESENLREIPGYWLMLDIIGLTQCPKPTIQQWTSWLAANQTVLGKLSQKDWQLDPGGTFIRTYGGPNHDVFITKASDPPFEQFDTVSQSILRASPPVPSLWLWVGSNIPGNVYEADIAQDAWLAEALKSLFYISGTQAAKNRDAKIVEFIKKNKPAIDKVRSSFFQQPQKLGSGVDGVAFDIGENRVLKIFRDRLSFLKSMEAINRLHKQPQVAKTEAMIYDAGLLGRFQRFEDQSVDIYYYIMEKMTPIRSYYGVDEEVRKILQHVATYIRDNVETFQDLRQQIRDPEDLDNVKKEVARLAENIAGSLMARSGSLLDKIEDKIPTLRRGWLSSYIEEIMTKYITGRGDLHMGNLGVTSYGDLRYYDPSHEDWTHQINVPLKNSEDDSYPQRNTKSPTLRSDEE